MENEQLLARLSSIDKRLSDLGDDITRLSQEVGELRGRLCSNGRNALLLPLIKYVIFPLILVVGGVVSIKLLLPM